MKTEGIMEHGKSTMIMVKSQMNQITLMEIFMELIKTFIKMGIFLKKSNMFTERYLVNTSFLVQMGVYNYREYTTREFFNNTIT